MFNFCDANGLLWLVITARFCCFLTNFMTMIDIFGSCHLTMQICFDRRRIECEIRNLTDVTKTWLNSVKICKNLAPPDSEPRLENIKTRPTAATQSVLLTSSSFVNLLSCSSRIWIWIWLRVHYNVHYKDCLKSNYKSRKCRKIKVLCGNLLDAGVAIRVRPRRTQGFYLA